MQASRPSESMSQSSYDSDMKKDPYALFLNELKDARLAQGLSQSELAQRIKLSRAQYTAIENGRSEIKFVHIYNLAVTLKRDFVIGKSTSLKKKTFDVRRKKEKK
jgi:transcriptional regulator with XRE-family HTH domain